MIEQYFEEDNVALVGIKDNGVSLTFECSCPNWEQNQFITLSDLGVASTLGLKPKDYSREDFLEEVRKLFPIPLAPYLYYVKEWEFPIPEEWIEQARIHVSLAKQNKKFSTIDAKYLLDIEPPLYAYCLLQEIISEYAKTGINSIPSDLSNLSKDPKKFFTPDILYIRRSI